MNNSYVFVKRITDLVENNIVENSVLIRLPKECIERVDKQIEAKAYRNRSHTIETIILEK